MKTNLKVLCYLSLSILLVGVAAWCFNFVDIGQFLFGTGGVCLAVGPVVGPGTSLEGTVTHEGVEGESDIHDLDLDEVVVKVRPSDTPMDTLTRELKSSRETGSIQTGGWEVGTRDVEDSVIEALTGTSDVHAIKVGKKQMWLPDDTLIAPGVVGADGKPLMLYVLSKGNQKGELNVIAANPVGNKIPDIPANTVLLRLGSAKSETDAQTVPFSVLPSPRYNFCQIHMCQVEESVVESLAKKKVVMDFSTYKEQSVWDWKRAMEFTNLFGVQSSITNPDNNKLVYTSDGIWNQITEAFEFDKTKSFDNAFYVSLTKNIFSDNNGSDRKILFAGDDFMERMAYVDAFQKQIEAQSVEVVHGVRFHRIVTNFGELLVKPHHLMRGSYADCAMVLDMSYIRKDVYEGLHMRELDLDGSGQKRVKAVRMIEHYCLFAENLPSHRKIRPQV